MFVAFFVELGAAMTQRVSNCLLNYLISTGTLAVSATGPGFIRFKGQLTPLPLGDREAQELAELGASPAGHP